MHKKQKHNYKEFIFESKYFDDFIKIYEPPKSSIIYNVESSPDCEIWQNMTTGERKFIKKNDIRSCEIKRRDSKIIINSYSTDWHEQPFALSNNVTVRHAIIVPAQFQNRDAEVIFFNDHSIVIRGKSIKNYQILALHSLYIAHDTIAQQ